MFLALMIYEKGIHCHRQSVVCWQTANPDMHNHFGKPETK
jgi:hypothetical protein